MENKRLKEIKLALCLNHIDKSSDKIEYTILIRTLSALAAALGKEEHEIFIRMFQASIGDGLMGATNKELVATYNKYYTVKTMSQKFGKSDNWFFITYKDLLSRNFDTEEYLDSLKPRFKEEKEINLVNFMLDFIENVKFELGEDSSELSDKERTLEIEFYLVYKKLIEVLQNAGVVNKFIFNVCNLMNIDFNSVAQLKNNIHYIDRSFPHFKYNNRYFMQEICTLYTKKGLSLGAIGSKVLGKGTNFFYNNTNKEYAKIISKEDLEWQYVPTLDWENIDKGAIYKFLNILHTYIRYDI